MPRILGIDPGSRITGFGVIDTNGASARYLASGTIRTQELDFPRRLRCIFEQVSEVVETYKPDVLAIEEVFVHRNVDSALKLGQARGAAICACVTRDLSVAEYAPRAIKLAVVGSGAASKEQVQFMVRALLSLQGNLQIDASDALAVALCHSQHRLLSQRLIREPARGGA
jgi:crossover junction endodeoxyribonuclease RuvC